MPRSSAGPLELRIKIDDASQLLEQRDEKGDNCPHTAVVQSPYHITVDTASVDGSSSEIVASPDVGADTSVHDQFNGEMLMYFSNRNGIDGGGGPEKDAMAEEEHTRRVREGQLHAIQARRGRSKRKFDLVEEMFAKSVDRRLRAMRKVAADPPADRLIGRSMAQYIPAGLLPGQQQQTSLFMRLSAEDVDGRQREKRKAFMLESAHDAAAGTENSKLAGTATSSSAANTIVFLTEMDEATGSAKIAKQERQLATSLQHTGSISGIGVHPIPLEDLPQGGGLEQQQQQQKEKYGTAKAQLLLPPPDVEHWRELGYEVVYVNSNAEALSHSRRRRNEQTREKEEGKAEAGWAAGEDDASGSLLSSSLKMKDRRSRKGSTSVYDEYAWMRLAPLPPVCLVQRRLPEESLALSTTGGDSQLTKGCGVARRSGREASSAHNNNSQWSFKK